MDMEVPSYKLNASLRGVLAQRLLRQVCPECSTERPINDAESQFTGIRPGTPIRIATALNAEEKNNENAKIRSARAAMEADTKGESEPTN